MKIALIYYSLTGNVNYVVNILKDLINCDIYEVEYDGYPKKGLKKFFCCGKSACLEEIVDIKCNCNIDKYDHIVLAFPIWASNITPPIRSFIEMNKNKLTNKTVSVIISYSGGGDKKVIEKLKNCLKVNGFQHIMFLKNPKTNNEYENIEEFSDKLIKEID